MFIPIHTNCVGRVTWPQLRIEHGGSGVKRDALFNELLLYPCKYELYVSYINKKSVN